MYTLGTIKTMQEKYKDFLEKSEGIDPDFPMMNFGGKGGKGKVVKGTNISQLEDSSSE